MNNDSEYGHSDTNPDAHHKGYEVGGMGRMSFFGMCLTPPILVYFVDAALLVHHLLDRMQERNQTLFHLYTQPIHLIIRPHAR